MTDSTTNSSSTQKLDPEFAFFDLLPDEILLKIFRFLDAKDLFHVACANKRCKRISDDKNSWTSRPIRVQNLSTRLCLHTLYLLFNKPVTDLEVSYFGSRTWRKCQNSHPQAKIQENYSLESLKILIFPDIEGKRLKKIVERCRRVREFTCNFTIYDSFPSFTILCAIVENLEVLRIPFCDCYMKQFFVVLMEKATRLRVLHLRIKVNEQYNPFDVEVFPRHLLDLKFIYFENLFDTLVDDDFVEAIVRRCPDLETLSLPYCDITAHSLVMIAGGLRSLESLTLGPMDEIEGELLELEGIKSLRFLAVPIFQGISSKLRARVRISHSVLCEI